MKIGFAITSSFCTFDKVLIHLIELKEKGYDIYPVISPKIVGCITRFGDCDEFIKKIENITGKKVVKDIIEAEKFGPCNKMDAMIVMPATGDFIAKMAHGITDNPVNLAVKATLRNNSPIVIAISTNDGLSLNGENIMKLYNQKNIYFVPFGQDNYECKPNSLIAHYDLIIPTLEEALNNKQIQPVLQEYQKVKRK